MLPHCNVKRSNVLVVNLDTAGFGLLAIILFARIVTRANYSDICLLLRYIFDQRRLGWGCILNSLIRTFKDIRAALTR